jgi:hemerythrin-like metal-binding protein
LGGDEFVVLLPDLAQHEDAHGIAERIRAMLAEPFVMDDGHRIQISASIGVAVCPEHALTPQDLLQAGDEAMYAAKRSGRNRIAYSDRTATPVAVPQLVRDSLSGLIHLTWDASLVSGNAFIDTEHRELFRQSNQLLDLAISTDARPGAVRSCLLHLADSIEAHFEHEERILGQVGYAGLASHAARHRVLAERTDELCRRAAEQPATLAEILDFVVAKIVYGHLVSEDREYFSSLAPHPTK